MRAFGDGYLNRLALTVDTLTLCDISKFEMGMLLTARGGAGNNDWHEPGLSWAHPGFKEPVSGGREIYL